MNDSTEYQTRNLLAFTSLLLGLHFTSLHKAIKDVIVSEDICMFTSGVIFARQSSQLHGSTQKRIIAFTRHAKEQSGYPETFSS